jgi:hypothetical protein
MVDVWTFVGIAATGKELKGDAVVDGGRRRGAGEEVGCNWERIESGDAELLSRLLDPRFRLQLGKN